MRPEQRSFSQDLELAKRAGSIGGKKTLEEGRRPNRRLVLRNDAALMPIGDSPNVVSNRAELIDAVIGARMRERRYDLRISQAKLTKHLGVSHQQVPKYERGDNRLNIQALVVVARALHCSVDELLPSSKCKRLIGSARDDESHRAAAAVEAFSRIQSAAMQAGRARPH